MCVLTFCTNTHGHGLDPVSGGVFYAVFKERSQIDVHMSSVSIWARLHCTLQSVSKSITLEYMAPLRTRPLRIQMMEAAGFIEPSTSSYCSPMVVVEKGDKVRIYGDSQN